MKANGEIAARRAVSAPRGGGFGRSARGVLAGLATLALAACTTPFAGGDSPFAAAPSAPAGERIGEGSVPVAMLLPLTGQGQGSAAAEDMRNAARLALSEFNNPDIQLTVYDTAGTPEGARAAAQAALAQGAELMIGPLFAGSVQSAGQVAQAANVPVLAFSTDATVASRGVYLMGFLPQPEVERVVDYAAQNGRRAIAALIPQTTYGNVVEAQFRETAARRGVRVVQVERYPAGQPQQAVARIAGVAAGAAPQVDALFIPESPQGLVAVSTALQAAGFDPSRVKPLGTGLWNEPSVMSLPALQGGWYAAPEQSGFQNFASRYGQAFNEQPIRIASLAYDAVSLAAALNRTQGTQRFSEAVLTNRSGFAGVDGVFRFRADGLNDRALAVYEVRGGGASVVGPAPRALPDA
ncbi:penicillin-binding protein activator [Salinarimonas sp. NSM]|uniref:penicillin-binding protein activator n=1 Tax=Salinarimonas sp. NSM TaxID=3458003 RepID=UPI004036DB68